MEQELNLLDEEYQAGLNNGTRDGIIVSHDAFGYLAARYDIEQYPISGLSPDQEPSTRTLAELTDLVQEQGIKYVMGETLYSNDLAELIAEETGAEVLVLSPIASLSSSEEDSGETYLTLMRRNLSAIQTAMECQI